MKRILFLGAALLTFLIEAPFVFAQDDLTIVSPASEPAEGLDLQSVAELFKDSENLEQFEKSLNDPDVGINNLDLNDDQDVDYIAVVDETEGDVHFIILRVPLGYEDYQDVAIIEVIKVGDEDYEMEIQGDEEIYGPDHYYAPTVVHIHTWPLVRWIYGPVYRPYRSVYKWGFYPVWWKPYRPAKVNIYHARIVKYRSRNTFVFTKTRHIKTVHKVKYVPHSSKLVRKKKVIKHTPKGKTGIRKVGKERVVKKERAIKKEGKVVKRKTNINKGKKKPAGKDRK